MKISRKLPILIVSISLVPIILVAIICYGVISGSSLSTYKGIIKTSASSASKIFDDFYQSQINNIKYYKSIETYSDFVKDPSNKEKYNAARTLLEVGVNTDTNIYNTMIIDMQGNVLCSVDEKYDNANVAGEEYFTGLINKDMIEGVNVGIIHENKSVYISLSTFIKSGAESIGIICNIINLDYINSNVENTQIGSTGYIYVIDNTGEVISNKYEERVGYISVSNKNITQLYNLAQSFADGTLESNFGYIEYSREGHDAIGRYERTRISDLIVVCAITKGEILYQALQITSYILIFALITIIVSIVLGLRTAYKLINSLNYMSEKIKEIADGDLKARCEYNKNDEFKLLCNDINIMAENMENANNRLLHMATVDVLTKLNNRKAIYDIMDDNYEDTHQAVMLIDLNGFKAINDNLGHDYGDIALKKVANVLRTCQNNNVDVARLGGDEFLVFVKHFENEKEVFDLAEHIYDRVKQINMLDDKPAVLSASIGVAFKREADIEKSSIIKKADNAMYKNKKANDNKKYVVYDAD